MKHPNSRGRVKMKNVFKFLAIFYGTVKTTFTFAMIDPGWIRQRPLFRPQTPRRDVSCLNQTDVVDHKVLGSQTGVTKEQHQFFIIL